MKKPTEKPSSPTRPPVAPATRRLGLLGGTFDPIHLGHLELARQAIATRAFDTLWLSPTPQNPLKDTTLLPADVRWECVRKAVATLADPRVEASDAELRSDTRYTIDTVRARAAEGWSVTIVCGTDAFRGLPRWKEARLLAESVEWLVVARANAAAEFPADAVRSVAAALGLETTVLQNRVRPLAYAALPISSTELRAAMLAFFRTGEAQPALRFLPSPVWECIQANADRIRKVIDSA